MSNQIDPRGPRFGAAITTVVLAIILLTIPTGTAAGTATGTAMGTAMGTATVLLTIQTLVFALGAFVGLQAQPYGIIYRKLVLARIGKPTGLEAAEPPQFAQLVGFLFAAVALVALVSGADLIATVAVGFALAAAFLNAAFNFCLGCEMYLIGKRIFS